MECPIETVKNVGKWGGKDAKGQEGKRGGERQALLLLRRGKKEAVMTSDLCKGNKNRLRSCNVPHADFLWTK